MMSTTINRVLIGKIEKGKDLLKELHRIVREEEIKGGVVMVIGALSRVCVGYFDPDKKEYIKAIMEGIYELTSGLGNISISEDGKTIVHVHIVAQNYAGKTVSGHLLDGSIVGVTAEYAIFELSDEVKREYDDETGLYLLKL